MSRRWPVRVLTFAGLQIDHVQAALEVLRIKQDGLPASPATVNMTIAAVKAFLGFAHQVGYTCFNAAPLIKLRKAPRQLDQRILSEFDTQSILSREAWSRTVTLRGRLLRGWVSAVVGA